MNPKLKFGLIAVIGVTLIVLVLLLVQNPGQKVSVTATPTSAGVSSPRTPSSSAVVTSTVSIAATSATTQPQTVAVTTTPAFEPTMTAEEQKAVEEVRSYNPQSQASSPEQCPTILQTQPWCSLLGSAKQITRPEWEDLLPQAEFFLVPYTLLAQESRQSRHVLVIKQDGQSYSAETYDRLLDANGIVITDINRELIMKAFVLMTLANYLEQDIAFSDWTQGDWPGSLGRRFTYSLTVWTKIQGLRMKWFFAFEKDRLWLARQLREVDYHVGDYTDVPLETLPLPGLREYLFRGE